MATSYQSYSPYALAANNKSTVKAKYFRGSEITSDLDLNGATQDLIIKVRDTDSSGSAVVQNKNVKLDAYAMDFYVQDVSGHLLKDASGQFQLLADTAELTLNASNMVRAKKDLYNDKNMFFDESGNVLSKIEKLQTGDLYMITNAGDIHMRRAAGTSTADKSEVVFTQFGADATATPLIKAQQDVDLHLKAGSQVENHIIADSILNMADGTYITTDASSVGVKIVPDAADPTDYVTFKNNGANIEMKVVQGDMELDAAGGHIIAVQDVQVKEDIMKSEVTDLQVRATEAIVLGPNRADAFAITDGTANTLTIRAQDSVGADSDAGLNIGVQATKQNLQLGAIDASKEVILLDSLRLKDEIIRDAAIELTPSVPQGASETKATATRNKLIVDGSGSTGTYANGANMQLRTSAGDLQFKPVDKVQTFKSFYMQGDANNVANEFVVDASGASAVRASITTTEGAMTTSLVLEDGSCNLVVSSNAVVSAGGNVSLSATGPSSTALLSSTATTTVDASSVTVHAKDASGTLWVDADGALDIDVAGVSTFDVAGAHTEVVTGAVSETYGAGLTTSVTGATTLSTTQALTMSSTAGAVDVNAATVMTLDASQSIAATAGTSMSLMANSGNMTLDASGATSDLVLRADRDILATADKDMTLTASDGTVQITALTSASSEGHVDINAAGNLTADASGTGAISTLGALTMSSSLSATMQAGTTALVDGGNEVVLDAPLITLKNGDTAADLKDAEVVVEGSLTVNKNLFVQGDFSVAGTVNALSRTELNVEDKVITLASAETGNKIVYYQFQVSGSDLQYKRYTEQDTVPIAWTTADPSGTVNLYEGVTYYFKDASGTTSWSNSSYFAQTAGSEAGWNTYKFGLPGATDVTNATPTVDYTYGGITMKFALWDENSKITRDGIQNDGAGLLIEGYLPKDISFADSTLNNSLAEKSLKWNASSGGVIGFKPNASILPYNQSSVESASFWEMKGGALQLTRAIHGHAWVSHQGLRSTSNPDVTVSYRFEIDDNETLRIVKVAGTNGNGTPLATREVVAVMGSGFTF